MDHCFACSESYDLGKVRDTDGEEKIACAMHRYMVQMQGGTILREEEK